MNSPPNPEFNPRYRKLLTKLQKFLKRIDRPFVEKVYWLRTTATVESIEWFWTSVEEMSGCYLITYSYEVEGVPYVKSFGTENHQKAESINPGDTFEIRHHPHEPSVVYSSDPSTQIRRQRK